MELSGIGGNIPPQQPVAGAAAQPASPQERITLAYIQRSYSFETSSALGEIARKSHLALQVHGVDSKPMLDQILTHQMLRIAATMANGVSKLCIEMKEKGEFLERDYTQLRDKNISLDGVLSLLMFKKTYELLPDWIPSPLAALAAETMNTLAQATATPPANVDVVALNARLVEVRHRFIDDLSSMVAETALRQANNR